MPVKIKAEPWLVPPFRPALFHEALALFNSSCLRRRTTGRNRLQCDRRGGTARWQPRAFVSRSRAAVCDNVLPGLPRQGGTEGKAGPRELCVGRTSCGGASDVAND